MFDVVEQPWGKKNVHLLKPWLQTVTIIAFEREIELFITAVGTRIARQTPDRFGRFRSKVAWPPSSARSMNIYSPI
jgi:hypothetical protein